jgi:hypothetical protein
MLTNTGDEIGNKVIETSYSHVLPMMYRCTDDDLALMKSRLDQELVIEI